MTRDHPDRDLLAALPHGWLTTNERGAVLSHLAECSECRQAVMFLAETEELRPKPGRLAWRQWAIGAVAAAVITFFPFAFTRHSHSRPENGRSAVFTPTWKYRNFQHVKLTQSEDSGESDALIVHLAGFKPNLNQIVVRSQYGERWLTFDSFLNLAN
jgi:hypothetical protein